MKLPPPPDLDLVTTLYALAGRPEALARLVERYRPHVLDLSRRALGRRRALGPAAELAQEVWLRLLDRDRARLRSFDPHRGPFGHFLQLVAWQQALVVASAWARRQWHELPHPPCGRLERSCPPEADVLEHRQVVLLVVDEVMPRQPALDRALFEELYLRQARVTEAAPRLGRTPAALHKRNERLRARLHRALRELDAPLAPAA